MAGKDLITSFENRQSYGLLHVIGPITATHAAQLRREAERTLSRSEYPLGLELSEVTDIDNAGIALLNMLVSNAEKQGKKLFLAGADNRLSALVQKDGFQGSIQQGGVQTEATAPKTNEVDIEDNGLYVHLRIAGRFDLSVITSLRNALEQAMSQGRTVFVFDLSQTTMLTSVGIGILANLHKRVAPLNGKVHLVSVSDATRKVLNETRLDEILGIHDDISDIETDLLF